jgi:hypothetical protein
VDRFNTGFMYGSDLIERLAVALAHRLEKKFEYTTSVGWLTTAGMENVDIQPLMP